MVNLTAKRNIFKVKYLPDFATWILKNKLEEFVLVSIRYCREADLPLINMLANFTEQELVEFSMESNRGTLQAISENKIVELVVRNAKKWIENSLEISDKETHQYLSCGC